MCLTCVLHLGRNSQCEKIEIRYIGDLARFGKCLWFSATGYDRGSEVSEELSKMILKYYNRFEMRFTAGNFTRLAKVGNGNLDDINNFAKGVRDAKRFLKRLG